MSPLKSARRWRATLVTAVAAATLGIGTALTAPATAAGSPAAQTAVVAPQESDATAAAPQAPADAATTADWNPPAHLVQPLDEVWRHVEQTYGNLYGFRNYGWDQLMANGGGHLNYCVRWESGAPVSAQLRDQVHRVLQEQSDKWYDRMRGFDGFPQARVQINVVGWATANRSTFQWDDDSVDLYIGNLDGAGAPQCAPECGRFFNQDGNYTRCPGGAARHYDQSLWLTDGFGGGAGGDWGQRIGREYFIGALNQPDIHILLHEIGHTLGLDDFYDWTPTGVPNFLMKAGTATQVTEFDVWMARDFWRHMKYRYDL
ncbi:hypothetical protein [Streptomyces sp. AA0539]|uniref:hypothetical protein n=1 Tax=Streptomyces sp. AA0539 TaxID=1210045 RepID=UPI0002F523DA|nr:hypothetical protein [Streptomyces sp. AA0539]